MSRRAQPQRSAANRPRSPAAPRRRGDGELALRVEDLLLTLTPDHPLELWTRASILSALGAYREALADVEKKQCALLVAGFGEARNVQHGAVVEADVADGDEASARSERCDDIVGGHKLFLRRDHFDANAFALLHRQPRGVLQRKFPARGDNFVAGLPRERVRDGGGSGAGAGGECDFFGRGADKPRDVRAKTIRNLKEDRVCYLVREFIRVDGGLHRFDHRFRHGRLAGEIEIRGALEFKPFLAPIGDCGLRYGCGAHRCVLGAEHDSRQAAAKPILRAQSAFDKCQYGESSDVLVRTPTPSPLFLRKYEF